MITHSITDADLRRSITPYTCDLLRDDERMTDSLPNKQFQYIGVYKPKHLEKVNLP